MEEIYYAGIGSTKTPYYIVEYFEKLGLFFAKKGLILRSGHAKGSDQAFEKGCDRIYGKKEIYIPYKNYQGSNSSLIFCNPNAYLIAKKFRGDWGGLSFNIKKLLARNCHQILGKNLNKPSSFVICWTQNGEIKGGTGLSIKVAKSYNIPVFNAGKYNNIDEIKKELKKFLIDNKIFLEEDFLK